MLQFYNTCYGGAVAGTASADVESANICGFQNVSVVAGWNFFVPTFKDIAHPTEFYLENITPMRLVEGVATPFATSGAGRCNGSIYVNKVDEEGEYLDQYRYYSSSATKIGWYNKAGTQKIDPGTIKLSQGEGLVVNNTTGADIVFQVSGEVDLYNKNTLRAGWNFSGNWTPVEIDINDITPMRIVEGVPTPFATSGAGRCNGSIYVNKVDTDGEYLDQYRYYSSSTTKIGWYNKAGTTKITTDDKITFRPGQGIVVNNTTGSAIVFSIKSPIE